MSSAGVSINLTPGSGLGGGGGGKSEPDEYNLYLGFMIPIGAILALCIICLFVISWQLICPTCSKKFCPKSFLQNNDRNTSRPSIVPPSHQSNNTVQGRRTSVTLVRRYSDFPPSYEALTEQSPPSYNSVVIIEEEAPPGDRSSRASGIRTYVYDPARRISIEVHDEDTIRVVEELLSRRRTSSLRSTNEPPGYNHVIRLPDKYPNVIPVSDV
nr:uncharacterized protein LOC100176148 [Ciona intestinalis]XP_026690742.1 uncharacterized protein LOC100176148 [Ciona intestinalis]|eukprot:XP_009859049.1 uncharacterized protein LOC100176148 [Ciona intestinalis]